MEDGKKATIDLARSYAQRGNPNGWFEEFYARAGGDIAKIYWADLAPNPCLVSWLEAQVKAQVKAQAAAQSPRQHSKRAVVIGCGLGDDAEVLARHGYRVTAFDISESAVAMCQARYPDSGVDYVVADLFTPPQDWLRGFDLVFECNTIQILVGDLRGRARDAIAELVAPGGVALVSCRSREPDDEVEGFPIPMDRHEIDGFQRAGLLEEHFDAYDDEQNPPVPHYFAVYRRPE